MDCKVFYESLCFRLKISEEAYAHYICTRTYLTALDLLYKNKQLLEFLDTNIIYSKKYDKSNLQHLVSHYTSWISDFESYVLREQPEYDSLFIFPRSNNSSPYPKDFIEKLFFEWYTDKNT